MEYNVYISASKIMEDGSRIYAVDLYCNNIYEIDLYSEGVKVIGELAYEEEQVYTIFDIHICDNKLVMLPRNGNYIHVFDIEKKEDFVYDLKKEMDYKNNNVYDCFSFCFEKNIYMFNRNNGSVLMYDYVRNCMQRIETNKKYEWLQLVGSFVIDAKIYMPSQFLNKIIIFSAYNKEISEITLPEKLKGISKVYKIEKYIVTYQDSSHYVFLLNLNGEILKKYETKFKEKQIEPFICKAGNCIFVFGNSGGECCKINIEINTVETQIINELRNIEVDYVGQSGQFIYCFKMTKTYEQSLNSCIKINIQTLEVTQIKLEFNEACFEKEINSIYDQNISRYLLKKTIHPENCSINLNRFLKCDFYNEKNFIKNNHGCGKEIFLKVIN